MAIGKRDRDRLGAGTPQGSRGAHFRPVGSADACGCAGEPTLGGAPVRRGGRRPLKRAVIVAVAVLAMCGAGGAVAWFGVQDNVLNTFTRGEIQPSIEEAFDASSTVKENVFVKNEGTAPAYMRATVSIYWEDKNGNQLWDAPQEGQGYSITWGDALRRLRASAGSKAPTAITTGPCPWRLVAKPRISSTRFDRRARWRAKALWSISRLRLCRPICLPAKGSTRCGRHRAALRSASTVCL